MGKDQELLDAARTGNFGIVEKLIFPKSKSSSLAASLGIRVGPYINCQDQAGYTPLHHASLNGHGTIVKILLDAGADVNVSDVKGCCPLHLAAWNGNAEIVKLLLTTGPNFASINEQNGDRETALHCASQHGHSEAVRILLENHSDPEIRNIRDESALDLASQYGRLEVVRTLLSFHPKILVHSPERFTPLHLASRNGHRGVVELLLAHGADINKVGANGTALHEAALFGKNEVVSLLLKRGAETNSKDSSGRTALELVSQLDTQISREIGKLIVARIQDGDDYEQLPSIVLSTPKKPKQLRKDVKRTKKLGLGESTNISASTSSLSRNFSRSFGEADLAYRDSMRGRPQMADSFRLSQAAPMTPETSQSPTRSRIKHGLLRRTSSARSARSLPRLASSSSFHGNRSLHSFSTHRKKSDAMSLQDWSVRQHHPSIDMFPVNPTQGSQSGRKTSVSEPSSPQMAPAFITPIHTPESLESPGHDSTKTDDNVFLPGNSSRHPSFELSNSQNPRPAPKAIIPLKPPADDISQDAFPISTFEASLKVSRANGSNSSAVRDTQPQPTAPSSGGLDSTPSFVVMDEQVSDRSTMAGKKQNADSADGAENQIKRSSSSNTLAAGSSGQHLSTSSDLKSPGAPKKPYRNKPSKPPPLPPKPAHMVKKLRPPSPINPPPEDEIFSDSDDEDGNDGNTVIPELGQNQLPLQDLEIHEPTSPLYGNISYDNHSVTESNIDELSVSLTGQVEQGDNHDNKQIFDQSEVCLKNSSYASIKKLETSPQGGDGEKNLPMSLSAEAYENFQRRSLKRHNDNPERIGNVHQTMKIDNSSQHSVTYSEEWNTEQGSKLDEVSNQNQVKSTDHSSMTPSSHLSESSKGQVVDALTSRSNHIQHQQSPRKGSKCNQQGFDKAESMKRAQSSKLTNKSLQETGNQLEYPSQSSQSSNSTRIVPKPSFRSVRPVNQSQLKVRTTEGGKAQSSMTQSLKLGDKSKNASLFPPQPVKEQVSRIATITHLKSTTELKMNNTQCVPKLPDKKSKQKPGNSHLVAPLPAPRSFRKKPNQEPLPRRKAENAIPTTDNEGAGNFHPVELSQTADRPEVSVSQHKVTTCSTNAADSTVEPLRWSNKSHVEGTNTSTTSFSNLDAMALADKVAESTVIPMTTSSRTSTFLDARGTDVTENDVTAFPAYTKQGKTPRGSKDHEPDVNSNIVVPFSGPEELDLPEPCPSPPFSPPSPKTAMNEVSSTLQKMIPTIPSSSDETMHIFSASSNLQSTELLKNKDSRKPDIPPKKLSMRQHKYDKKHYFIESEDNSSKSLPKLQSNKKSSPALKPKSRFNFSQKLASFATFPPRSEISASGKSTQKKNFLSGVKSHLKPQVNKMKKTSKLTERSENARRAIEASSTENTPIKQRLATPDGETSSENAQNSFEMSKNTKKLSDIARPKSGLTYTSPKVKRARICSTKSVTDIPTAPSYGEYDNLDIIRSKRSSSLGPQVPTPLPKKPSNITHSRNEETQSPPQSRSLTRSIGHDQPHSHNIPASSQTAKMTGHDRTPSKNDLIPRSRLPFRQKSLNHDDQQQKSESQLEAPKPSAINHAMSFQENNAPENNQQQREDSVSKIPLFEQSRAHPARRFTSPASKLSRVQLKTNRSMSLNQNMTSQKPSSKSPTLSYKNEKRVSAKPTLEGQQTPHNRERSPRENQLRVALNSPQLKEDTQFARPRSLTSSPRPAPRIKPPLVKTPPTSLRNLQKPKKPMKPSLLLKPVLYLDKELPHTAKSEISSPGTDSSSIAARSVSSLDPYEDWSDALSDRTDDMTLPKEVKKYRGLIRGSSLSYRSRFCGSRDAYNSDEFDYDYHFDPPYTRVKSSQRPSERKPVKKVQRTSSKIARPGDLGHFPVTGEFMEVGSSPSSIKANLGEPGQKRRKGDKTPHLNDTLETVISQEDSKDRQYSRNSAYDNNNIIINEQTATKRLSKKSNKMTAVPTVPSPMSDGLPDFGVIVDTVTAVRNKASPQGSTSGVSSSSSSQSSTLAKQEPSSVNETDEWAQIANVMKSVGSSLNKGAVYAQEFEETFWKIMTGSELPRRVGTWLSDLNLSQYEEVLVGNGFDNISFLASNILEEQDLVDMNIQNSSHRRRLLDSAKNLPKIKTLASYSATSDGRIAPSSVLEWLRSIALEEYEDLFNKMGFMTLEKVSRMRDTEIAAIIPLLGHRKRIRASLGPMKLPKSRTVSQSSSKIKVKTSPPLPRSPLLDTVNFFKDYSQSVSGVKPSTNATLNAYGTASSSSSALTNYSSLSDQVVPVSISEEPELEGKDNKFDFTSKPAYSQKSDEKTPNFDEIFNLPKQEDDLLTLAINQLTDNTSPKDKDSNNMSTPDTEEIRVPNARRASYLSSNGELVLRPPNETTEEGVNISSWCHDPEVLIRSCCNYQAYYLGSMLVREVKGVESTVEACAKMKKSTDSMKKIPTVTLSISYKGVKFIDSKSKHEIAEHEIHNISFASQDADDLSTLAYITRDARTDHHYCHVFRVVTLDVAYEIILTLGQAFEIAYQLILKEKALKGGS